MKKIIYSLVFLSLFAGLYNLVSAGDYATLINDFGFKKVVRVGQKDVFKGGYKLYTDKGEKQLGYSVITDYGVRLSSSITSTQATIPVTLMSTKDGHALTMADFGSQVFLTLEAGANKEEIVLCTGISSLTFTGCSRGLAFHGTSTTEVSANKYSHQSGSSVILSNAHYVYENFVDKDSDETIGGIKNFTSLPTATTTFPTANNQLVTKGYADALTVPSSYWTLSGSDVYRSGGNVGIGTTTPSYPLSVNTGSNLFSINSSGKITNGGYQATPIEVIYGGTGTSTLSGLLQGSGTSTVQSITGTAGQIPYYNGTDTLLATSTIFIATSTNVGIGTTTPSSKLTVDGDISINGNILNYPVKTGQFTIAVSDTGTTTVTHNLGRTPRLLRITGMTISGGGAGNRNSHSEGTATSVSDGSCTYSSWSTAENNAGQDANNISNLSSATVTFVADITSISSTIFTIKPSANANGLTRFFQYSID